MTRTEVSESVARFFYDQCAGEHDGHMAAIPNTPVLHGLIRAHQATGHVAFAKFLREVADHLDAGGTAAF